MEQLAAEQSPKLGQWLARQAERDDDSGTTPIANATPITWTSGGWISGKTNPFGIEGWWWADNDCKQATAANLPCDEPESDINRARGAHGWSISSEQACVKGTLEAITDWTFQWGADMGFGSPPTTVRYDASAIKGFAFDITGTAPSTVKMSSRCPTSRTSTIARSPCRRWTHARSFPVLTPSRRVPRSRASTR